MSNNLPSNSLFQESKRKFIMKLPVEDSMKRSSSVHDNPDFRAFMSSMGSRSNSSAFKSKDSFANLFQSKDSMSDLFKSIDSVSCMYTSRDWNFNYSKKASIESSDEEVEHFLKTFQDTSKCMAEDEKVPAVPEAASLHSSVMKSQDWVVNQTLGVHVEIPYSTSLLLSDTSVSERIPGNHLGQQAPSNLLPTETHWDELFMSQLVPRTAFPVAVQTSSEILGHNEALLDDAILDAQDIDVNHSVPQVAVAKQDSAVTTLSSRPTKKRKRAPRKKTVPENKVYVEPMPLDVLLGRGGRSNHHHGNKRYREEVENLKEWYSNIDSKDSKTDLSQCLVDYVQSYGARFLEQDDQGWYIVENIVARRKASQALREDTDPEKRRAKRQRFLAKRAREEGERQNDAFGNWFKTRE